MCLLSQQNLKTCTCHCHRVCAWLFCWNGELVQQSNAPSQECRLQSSLLFPNHHHRYRSKGESNGVDMAAETSEDATKAAVPHLALVTIVTSHCLLSSPPPVFSLRHDVTSLSAAFGYLKWNKVKFQSWSCLQVTGQCQKLGLEISNGKGQQHYKLLTRSQHYCWS